MSILPVPSFSQFFQEDLFPVQGRIFQNEGEHPGKNLTEFFSLRNSRRQKIRAAHRQPL